MKIIFLLVLFFCFIGINAQKNLESYNKKIQLGEHSIEIKGKVLYSESNTQSGIHSIYSLENGILRLFYLQEYDGVMSDLKISKVKVADLQLNEEPTIMSDGYYELKWAQIFLGTKEEIETIEVTDYHSNTPSSDHYNDSFLQISTKDEATAKKFLEYLKSQMNSKK